MIGSGLEKSVRGSSMYRPQWCYRWKINDNKTRQIRGDPKLFNAPKAVTEQVKRFGFVRQVCELVASGPVGLRYAQARGSAQRSRQNKSLQRSRASLLAQKPAMYGVHAESTPGRRVFVIGLCCSHLRVEILGG